MLVLCRVSVRRVRRVPALFVLAAARTNKAGAPRALALPAAPRSAARARSPVGFVPHLSSLSSRMCRVDSGLAAPVRRRGSTLGRSLPSSQRLCGTREENDTQCSRATVRTGDRDAQRCSGGSGISEPVADVAGRASGNVRQQRCWHEAAHVVALEGQQSTARCLSPRCRRRFRKQARGDRRRPIPPPQIPPPQSPPPQQNRPADLPKA